MSRRTLTHPKKPILRFTLRLKGVEGSDLHVGLTLTEHFSDFDLPLIALECKGYKDLSIVKILKIYSR